MHGDQEPIEIPEFLRRQDKRLPDPWHWLGNPKPKPGCVRRALPFAIAAVLLVGLWAVL